jgi:hypothetical protein
MRALLPLLLLSWALAGRSEGQTPLLFISAEFAMCARGCALRGSPELRTFVETEVETGKFAGVTATHTEGE